MKEKCFGGCVVLLSIVFTIHFMGCSEIDNKGETSLSKIESISFPEAPVEILSNNDFISQLLNQRFF